MAREMLILWIGRTREPWESLCADYRQRISRFAPIRDLPLRAKKAGDARSQLRVEASAFRQALPDPCLTVVLDRRGKALDSESFSRLLTTNRAEWPHSIAFLLGSDLGLDPEIQNSARIRVSLGPMTLPHELARLVLYEQLYRAFAIEAGTQYHRRPSD